MNPKKTRRDQNEKILIVEDSPTQAEELKHILERNGFVVFPASNGKEALDILQKHTPDIIISDIVMPEMDGYELCRQIKADKNLRNIPVILLTSLSDPQDILKGLEAKADNFITKPYNEEFLVSRMRYVLATRQLPDKEKVQMSMTIIFAGRSYSITSDQLQIMNLLVSTYETAVQKNRELTEAQAELKELNMNLARKVKERTRDLELEITERNKVEEERKNLLEQLVRAEKLAAVGELISGVAHEINNPLTGIVGLSELLLREKKENLDEDTKKDLESIHQSSERIVKIVRNLLRFARREAPVRKNASINEIIDTILNIRNYEMKVRNIEVKKDYQPDLPLIMADPSQLEQVFLNIINNAEYAIRETRKAGTLTIATSLQEEQPEDKKVIIEISNTGANIPEDVFSKLFNPFFTTKPVGKGTGLGLSISYGIIKEHGGEIYVRNQAEGGAAFTIELPISGGG